MKHQYKLSSIILAGGLLTSCSQSDEPGITQLAPGQYPLELSATVDVPQSRSVGKDAWIGDGSETFGVRIGADGTVAKYVITDPTGKAEAATGTTPLYWDNTATATVNAWYPYDSQTDIDISDQSAGFADYDYLYASADGQSYLAPVNLNFTHKMAKVSYVLKAGKGITDADLSTATVKISGYTLANFSEGTLTGSREGWITPTADGEALLVPQNMTGKDFITIEMGDKVYLYTPESDNAGLLKEGLAHQYSITINAGNIEVSAVTGASWGRPLHDEVRVTAYYDGTESQPKPGDYFYSDGTWSDGGLRKWGADESMEWASPLPDPDNSKTVIGVVFYSGHNVDDSYNYSDTGVNSENCHGYVMALNDVGNDTYAWSTNRFYDDDGPTCWVNDWNGYLNKYYVLAFHQWNLDGFPAFKKCDEYGAGSSAAAPSSTSGWYLPSCGQLLFISQHPELEAQIQKANGSWFRSDATYWSSTQDIIFISDNTEMWGAIDVKPQDKTYDYKMDKTFQNYVRAVLSF